MEDQKVISEYLGKRAETLIKRLEKRNFCAYYAPTGAEAREKILSMIPEGSSVALTGSQTLEQIGVKPYLRESGKFNLFDPYVAGITKEESVARRKAGLTANVMVSSTNAITENGQLVNIDGMGNRVAAMIFGPDKVILAVGMNKVAPDVDTAFKRVRTIASPMNNLRLELPNPCTETGFCADCSKKTRICNYFVVHERSYIPDRIHIVLIGESYGY